MKRTWAEDLFELIRPRGSHQQVLECRRNIVTRAVAEAGGHLRAVSIHHQHDLSSLYHLLDKLGLAPTSSRRASPILPFEQLQSLTQGRISQTPGRISLAKLPQGLTHLRITLAALRLT